MLPTLVSWIGQAGLAPDPSTVAHTDQCTWFVVWNRETVLATKIVQPLALVQLTVVGLSSAVGVLVGIDAPPLPQFDRMYIGLCPPRTGGGLPAAYPLVDASIMANAPAAHDKPLPG
jgi:hypothetical protein